MLSLVRPDSTDRSGGQHTSAPSLRLLFLVALGLAVALLIVPPTVLAEESAEGSKDEGTAEKGGSDDGPEGEDKAAASEEPSPPLRFTDEDLEKYHRKPPKVDREGADAAGVSPPAKGAAEKEKPAKEPRKARTVPPGTTPGGEIKNIPIAPARPGEPSHAPMVRTPMEVATSPAADPAKKYRDQERREQFRTEQLQGLRDRIAQIDRSLEYLELKRLSILDPLRMMPPAPAGYDTTGEGRMKSEELLAKVEADIAELESERPGVREQLVEIETRFGHEARSR